MTYVDGFITPVPNGRLDDYKTLESKAGEIWKKHGALEYVSCVADDTPYGEVTSFPRAVQVKDDEVVVFSWIVYESREARDAINAKVMEEFKSSGLSKAFEQDPPFEGKRMIWGGFKPFLGL
ncbi:MULTISPECIES: DUF1428 domain-containing protein [Halomonadaceae]|uniref:DUF1428 domain-containing protein n=1 Tax=Halomonadaceae TaxID=28256 RepID=UPI0015974DB5|nr:MULTISPECIES: DUF1428 family protein [Halomonas]QJQ96321.1 DUF1428 family protein [Halomonas sp. PA5]